MYRSIPLFCLLFAAQLAIAPLTHAGERFSLVEDKNGNTIRLDRRTGAVSFCRKIGLGMACAMAADEHAAIMDDNSEMADRVAEMEKRIGVLEHHLADKKPTVEQTNDDNDNGQDNLSSSNTIGPGRELNVTERFLYRFIAMAKILKSNIQGN